MSETICVDATVAARGFTVSSDPYRWSVIRVATLKEAAKLLSLAAFRDFDEFVRPDNLTSSHEICDALARIAASPRSKEQKLFAFVRFFRAGLLIAGYGDEGYDRAASAPRLRTSDFSNTEADTFVQRCELILGEKQSTKVRRLLFKLWLCTVEGRNHEPTLELIKDWVRFHLTQENSKNRKWLSVINKPTREVLPALAAKLRIPEVHNKYSPRKRSLEVVLESDFFADWEKAFLNWVENRRYADVTKTKEAFLFLQAYWSDHLTLLDPELFFSAHLKRESLLEWASKSNFTLSDAKKLKLISQFIRAFVASTPFFAIPDEFDEEIFLKDCYAWPISNSDLSIISNKLGEEGRGGKSNNVSLPEHLIRQIEIILTENDMSWPKKRTGDWLDVPASYNSPAKRIYCPVLPNMILILLKLPLRGVQLRRLDSGEGDDYTYDLKKRHFIPNPSQHCGYWTRQPDVRNARRGVLRKFIDSAVQKEFCGFYINSNKTQDRKVLFDENSGYEIFWEFDEVIEIVLKTREWQETYNPVSGPIEFEDLPSTVFAEPSDAVKLRKAACFYLFRYPCGNKPNCEAPPTSQVLRNFWYETLAELERRLATEMDSPPILIDSWDGKVPMSSPYHLHGLRLGGLTRLAKVGVSPWILQNVVGGHANWVMTAFYIKPGFGFITAHLNERYIQAMQNSQKEFAQFLTEATIENVHRMALINNPRAEAELLAVRTHKSAYLMATLDNGICPNCQTLCDEGFEIIKWLDYKPKELQKKYGPVPILPSGKRDCGRCIFLITGTPFMDGTAVRCNEISVTLADSVTRQRDFIREIDKLENQRLKASRNSQKLLPSQYHQLQVFRSEYKSESDNMVELATSLDANLRRLEEIKALHRRLATDGQTGPALLLTVEEPQFNWGLIHRFEAIDELCRAARWFKSVKVAPLQNERLAMLLKIFARENMQPPLALLDRNESDVAIEALTELIRRRLDRQSVGALAEGYETFESLGLAADVDKTIESLPVWKTKRLEAVLTNSNI